MSNEQFSAAAKLWGMAYGIRLKDDESAPSRATHAIAVAMEHGAKNRTAYAMDAARYRTKGRRAFMAHDLGPCNVRIVPESYVDPIRCKDDSGRHRGLGLDPLETPEVQTFQRAWLELNRLFPKQAKILAYEYQRPDLLNQADRAKEAGVSLSQYKVELSRGEFWVRSAFALNQVLSESERKWGLTG